jgi:dynein heavy chain
MISLGLLCQLDQIEQPSRDGAFIWGLTLEGARWDEKAGVLEESRPKELFGSLPVILIRAVTADKAELKDAYRTPVYKTERRFREEVRKQQRLAGIVLLGREPVSNDLLM